MATLEGKTSESMVKLKDDLETVRDTLEKTGGRNAGDRAGLRAHTPVKDTRGRDSIVCGIPGLADLANGFGTDWCLHGSGAEKGVVSRPLMAGGAPTHAEVEAEEEAEEEERLKLAKEAVDSAEDKMGDYWTPPNGFPKHGFLTGTQPKDVIVKAKEGIAQQTAWDKVKSLFWWLQGDVPALGEEDWFSSWHSGKWPQHVYCSGDDGWRWADGRSRDFQDPSCGSDLTLHNVKGAQDDMKKHFLYRYVIIRETLL